MAEENAKEALKCVNEIIKVIEQYGFEFPEPQKSLVRKEPYNQLQLVKRILGILKNATEENAELKLQNAMRMLKSKGINTEDN